MEKCTRISVVPRGMIGTGAMYKEMVFIIIFHFYLEYSWTNRLQLQGFH